MYKFHLSNDAEQTYWWLLKRDRALFERIRTALERLQTDPHLGKRLVGPGKRWSLRVGVYRILYRIERRELLIYVIDIGHRGTIYR